MSAPSYEALRRRWETVCGSRLRVAEQHLYRQRPRRRPSGPATLAALADMQAKSGDRRFGAAIEAVRQHGFHRQDAGTWRSVADVEHAYVSRMLILCEVKGHSVRGAAASVAVEYWVAGKTFAAVVKKLERAYRRRTKPVGQKPLLK